MSKSVPQLNPQTSSTSGDLYHLVRSNVDYKIDFDDLKASLGGNSKLIYVDATYGDDSTGTPYSPSFPYQTIAAAEADASANDTILIYPGNYTDSSLGKDEVNYYFFNGAILSAVNCFTTKANNDVFKIYGEGEFIATGEASGASRIVYFDNHTGCNISLTARKISGTNARLFWFQLSNNAILNVDVKESISVTVPTATNGEIISNYSSDSVITIKAPEINTDKKLLISGTQGTGTVINIHGKINKTAGVSYYNLIDLYRGEVNIYGDIECGGTGSSGGVREIWVRNTPAYLTVYGNYSSNNDQGFISVGSSSSWAKFYGTIKSTGTLTCNPINVTGGTLYLNNDVIVDTTNTVISHTSGKTIINCLIENTQAASTHLITVAGSGLVLKQNTVLYTSDTAEKTVYAASAQNIKTYPGAVANYGVHANITEQVSTLTVSTNVDSE